MDKKFRNSNKLDEKSCLLIIKNLKIKMKSSDDTNISSCAVDFCMALKLKLQKIIESPKDYQNNKDIFESSNKIKQKLKKISIFAEDSVSTHIDECINLCDEIESISKTDDERFKEIQDARKKEAFSIESLKHVFDLTKKTVMNANDLINQYGQEKSLNIIDINNLPEFKKCEQFMSSPESENLDKKTFVKLVNNIRSDAKKAISRECSKIKPRNNDQIISDISKLLF